MIDKADIGIHEPNTVDCDGNDLQVVENGEAVCWECNPLTFISQTLTKKSKKSVKILTNNNSIILSFSRSIPNKTIYRTF